MTYFLTNTKELKEKKISGWLLERLPVNDLCWVIIEGLSLLGGGFIGVFPNRDTALLVRESLELTDKVNDLLDHVKQQIVKEKQVLEDMRNDPDYIKCREAWNAGIGWGLHGKTSEDIKDWSEAIDNQRALIAEYESERKLFEDLLKNEQNQD